MALKEGQILDLNTLEVVDAPKPAEEKETPDTKGDEKDDADEEDADENVDDKADQPEDKADDQADDADEKKDEGDADEPDKSDDADDKKDDDKKDDGEVEELDAYLNETYGEKFDIKNEEDLVATLEAIKDVEKENADLRKQLDEAKANTQPVFASDQEKKAFEFLKKFPADKLGEGYVTYAKLVSMDVDNLAPRTALEEKFILEHEELTREEALSKFEREYRRKYTVRESDYDSPEEAKTEQKDRDIDLKSDAAKAKKFLLKQQEEFKSKVTDKEASKESAQTNAQVQESVKANLTELDEYISKLNELTFSDDDGTPSFNYKFTKEQKALIKTSVQNWIGNPAAYEKDGKVRGGYDVESYAVKAAAMLFHEDMIDKAFTAGRAQGEILRADQIAKKKPSREAKAAIDGKRIPLTEEEQWEAALAAKKKKPVSRQYQ